MRENQMREIAVRIKGLVKSWPTRTRTTRIYCWVVSSDKPGCSLTTNSRSECLRRNTYPWPWAFTHDLNRNRISSWPDCGKCLHKFWFKFLRWFRSCRVHKMSMTIASCLTLILTQWPWTYRRCFVDLVVSITVISFVIIHPSIPKLEKMPPKMFIWVFLWPQPLTFWPQISKI